MTTQDSFNLVGYGLFPNLGQALGLGRPALPARLLKIVLLIAATWLPLFLLSLSAGNAFGDRVAVPLLRDPAIYSRFLFVIPLLVIAEVMVHKGLSIQVRHFLASGVIPPSSLEGFHAAIASVQRRRGNVGTEMAILVLAFAISLLARGLFQIGSGVASWERAGESLTWAGWWHMLVSLPIFAFFMLRWVWIFGLWAWFLNRVAKQELVLTPSHPDRSGGLGFLGWGIASFTSLAMAVSGVLSGSFARAIIHMGSTLVDLKYHLLVFVILALVIVHLPLVPFAARLARARFRGLLEIGALISTLERAFDQKWLRGTESEKEQLLECGDVSALADIAAAYDRVDEMFLIPFDKKASILLLLAVLIPMIPLLGTSTALQEILGMLARFMV